MRTRKIGPALALTAVLIGCRALTGPFTLPAERPEPSLTTAAPTADSTPTASTPAGAGCIPTGDWETGRVVNVVDGDTINVEIDGREYPVRYIGIDAPEDTREKEFFGREATARNRELVTGQEVRLAKDVSETDPYGRLLRFVFAGGRFVNYALVREGYAVAVTFPPDVSCTPTFLEAEAEARADLAGLWGAGAAGSEDRPSGTGSVEIRLVSYQGLSQNEGDEFVEIYNAGPEAVDLEGWTLSDEADHVFAFPPYSLAPGAACRVYTDEIHPESCGFNFTNPGSGIWNNSGDCATLRDAAGKTAAEFCY